MNSTKSNSTKMVFLMTDGDRFCKPEVMAYMPEEDYNAAGTMKVCYMHDGQHGPCSEAYALGCKPATFKQYRSLLFELKVRAGYSVEVLDANEWKRRNARRRRELMELDRSLVEVPKRSVEEKQIADRLIEEAIATARVA